MCMANYNGKAAVLYLLASLLLSLSVFHVVYKTFAVLNVREYSFVCYFTVVGGTRKQVPPATDFVGALLGSLLLFCVSNA